MRILIDGDSFPDIEDIISVCKKYNKRVIIYTDTSHIIESCYADVVTTMVGDNAADTILENEVSFNDLVLTNDYGVAVFALSKGAYVLNQYGKFYSDYNILYLLEMKNINRKLRKHNNVKGPRKRTSNDRNKLINSIIRLIGSDLCEKEK